MSYTEEFDGFANTMPMELDEQGIKWAWYRGGLLSDRQKAKVERQFAEARRKTRGMFTRSLQRALMSSFISPLLDSMMPTRGLLDSMMPTRGLLDSMIPTKGILDSMMPTKGILDSMMPTKGILDSMMPTKGILDSLRIVEVPPFRQA